MQASGSFPPCPRSPITMVRIVGFPKTIRGTRQAYFAQGYDMCSQARCKILGCCIIDMELLGHPSAHSLFTTSWPACNIYQWCFFLLSSTYMHEQGPPRPPQSCNPHKLVQLHELHTALVAGTLCITLHVKWHEHGQCRKYLLVSRQAEHKLLPGKDRSASRAPHAVPISRKLHTLHM